jgi:hypothetical protein
MRRSTLLLLTLTFSFSTQADAGIVTFVPVTPGSDVVHIDDLPASVAYDVFILPGGGLDRIDGFNLVIGSDDVSFGVPSWSYSEDFITNGQFIFDPVDGLGLYSWDLFVGGLAADRIITLPLGYRLGTLMVSYPPPGAVATVGGKFFEVYWEPLVADPLTGQGVLHVVPEPGVLVLTALGAVAMLRRRRVDQWKESHR